DAVATLSRPPAGSFRPLLDFLESFLQFNPGLRLFGDIYCGPNIFHEVARLVQDRMVDTMEVLDASIGKNNSVVHVPVCFLNSGSFIEFVKSIAIFRVHQSKELIPIWRVASLRI